MMLLLPCCLSTDCVPFRVDLLDNGNDHEGSRSTANHHRHWISKSKFLTKIQLTESVTDRSVDEGNYSIMGTGEYSIDQHPLRLIAFSGWDGRLLPRRVVLLPLMGLKLWIAAWRHVCRGRYCLRSGHARAVE